MKESELRIGNLVYDEQLEIVENVTINIIQKISLKIEHYKPIPITEEWLLEFGFNKRNGERYCDMHEEFEECTYYHFNLLELHYNPELDYYTDNSFSVELKLDYVHQLQNLYFALTYEELTFELK